MSIDKIKETYAKEQGFENWSEFLNNIHGFQIPSHMTEIAERYAQSQTQELIEIIKELTPMAEDGYKLHKKNGSHQDFLEDDRDILKKAKELLTKYNRLNKLKGE